MSPVAFLGGGPVTHGGNAVALSGSSSCGILNGQSDDDRHLTVTASEEAGSAKVALMYGDKQP